MHAKKLHVNCNSTSECQNGKSWSTAFSTLQQALDKAQSVDHEVCILVAQGTYFPSSLYTPNGIPGGPTGITDERMKTFYFPNGVHVVGGFKGTESSSKESNPGKYPTILSGATYYWHVVIIGDDASTPSSIANVSLKNITITQGNAQDRMILTGLIPESTTYLASGGAGLYISRNSKVDLQGVTFTDNHAGISDLENPRNFGSGAGLFCNNSDLVVRQCIFAHNGARNEGGAVYLRYSNQGDRVSKCLFSECKFESNGASLYAGAVSVRGIVANRSSEVIFNKCHLKHNTSRIGGAMYVSGIKTKITDCVFSGNTSVSCGGAIAHNNLTAAVVAKNTSQPIVREPLYVKKSTFENNTSAGNPVYEETPNNTLPLGGGAICCYAEGNLVVDDSTFNNNRALKGNGGAAINGYSYFSFHLRAELNTRAASTSVGNSNFTHNSALFGNGGAVASFGDETVVLNLRDNTFSDNTAPNGKGADVYYKTI